MVVKQKRHSAWFWFGWFIFYLIFWPGALVFSFLYVLAKPKVVYIEKKE